MTARRQQQQQQQYYSMPSSMMMQCRVFLCFWLLFGGLNNVRAFVLHPATKSHAVATSTTTTSRVQRQPHPPRTPQKLHVSLPSWQSTASNITMDVSWIGFADIDDSASDEASSSSSSSSHAQQQGEQQQIDQTASSSSSLLFQSLQTQTVALPTLTEADKAMYTARLLLIGAAALYGTNFSLVKYMGTAAEAMPVGLSTTLRFGLAALAMSPWLLVPSTKHNKTKKQRQLQQQQLVEDDETAVSSTITATAPFLTKQQQQQPYFDESSKVALMTGFEVGLWNMVGYIAQAVGLQTTAASTSAFLCSLAVVVVPFLDMISGKTLKQREWTGAAMALLGVGILEMEDLARTGFSLTAGDLASMIQPLAFGMGFWRLERAMHNNNPSEGKRAVAAQLLAVFLGSLVYTLTTDASSLAVHRVLGYFSSDPTLIYFLIWTGIISTALSIYMEAVALKTLTAAETTLLLSTEPLWGALFASFIIHEQFGMDAVLGGVLILSACLYSSLGIKGLQKLVGQSEDYAA
mmetsp:Transcript_5800/g.11828  ORF Transcript_5800/g.11828 Transcript_5800/m.11828 type:complete len:520 (-) Transcript_5800:214-1773(-)